MHTSWLTHTELRGFRHLAYWWSKRLKLFCLWYITLMNNDRVTSRQKQSSYFCRLLIKESIAGYEECVWASERLIPNSTLFWGWLYSPSGSQPQRLRTFSYIIPCVSVCKCVLLQVEKQVHLTNCSNVIAPTKEPAALAPTSSRQMKKVTDLSLWRLQIFLPLWEEKKSQICYFLFCLIKSYLYSIFNNRNCH